MPARGRANPTAAPAEETALASLADAVNAFTGSGARLWAAQAQAEAARMGLRTAQPRDLTPSERVADLVAQGLTNREVARTLFIATKTVDATLSRVYRKLGVRSRTELAWRQSAGTPAPGKPAA